MAKSVMPKSKAKTAYGLLSEVRKLILDEPRRYDQRTWHRNPRHLKDEMIPACGTVCCVAGWVDVLKNPNPVCLSWQTDWETPEVAAEILGLDVDVAWQLFREDKAGDRWDSELGVTGHAKRGARHIARFQQKYAKQLKAKRV